MRPVRSSGAIGGHSLKVLIASGLLLASCAMPRFAHTPQPAVDLSGHWVLEPAASDDAAGLIAAAVPPPRAKRAPEPRTVSASPAQGGSGRGGGSGDGPDGSRGGGRRGGRGDDQSGQSARPTDEAPAWGKVRPAEFVGAFALPPPKLEFAQQPSRVRIGADARRREFDPGDGQPFSVTDRYGSRKVSAGWQRDEFLVDSEDGARLKVVEHFRPRTDDHLELLVEFKAQGIKSLSVRSLYRRATDAELAAPSADGPPAPAPR